MTRLPHLEAALVAAAERLEHPHAGATSRAAHSLNGSGRGLRAAWRRRGRGAHAAFGLAGALVLAGGATGAAHVAGLQFLDPWNDSPTVYEPSGRPGESLSIRSPDGASPAWTVRAYRSKDGYVCTRATVAGDEDRSVSCTDTDGAAQEIYDSGTPGAALVGSRVLAGSRAHPRRLIVYGLADRGARSLTVSTPAGIVHARFGDGVLRAGVEKRPDGLSAEGRRALGGLPDAMAMKTFAAVIAIPAGFDPDYLVKPPVGSIDDDTPELELTTVAAYEHSADEARERARSQTLARLRPPVAGPTARQRAILPAFARVRTATDLLPPAALEQVIDRGGGLRRWGAQPAASRRLDTTDDGRVGAIYAVPGRETICLVGALAVTGCESLHGGARPGLEAVTCAPGLDPDLRLLYGFPPAGTTAVRLSYRGAEPKVLLVADLLVDVQSRTDPRITKVTWIKSGHERAMRTPVPWDSGRDLCRKHPGDRSGYAERRNGMGAEMVAPTR